jgi:DNA-binding transcriptional LysR family regulator
VTPPPDELESLRFPDLSTFLAVHRSGSITATARELGVTPSQVSKAIARLESALKSRLFNRGARGIALSSAGRQVVLQIEQIVLLARSLRRVGTAPEGELTIAAPSSLLPSILPRLINALPRTRIRGIELPSTLLRGYAAEELFHVALLPGRMSGAKWMNVPVGELRKSLLAPPAVAKTLGARPSADQILALPFVGPIAYDGGKYVASTDDCPVPLAERAVASEVDTMAVALHIAIECNQVVFGPVIAARREIENGSIVELPIVGWSVSESLFVAFDAARVLARVQTTIVSTVRAALAEVPQPRSTRG